MLSPKMEGTFRAGEDGGGGMITLAVRQLRRLGDLTGEKGMLPKIHHSPHRCVLNRV